MESVVTEGTEGPGIIEEHKDPPLAPKRPKSSRSLPPRRHYPSSYTPKKPYRRESEPLTQQRSFSDESQRSYRKRYYYRTRTNRRSGYRRNVTCSNCNGRGHLFRECKKPIQSNGMLAWTLRPVTTEAQRLLDEDTEFSKMATPAMQEQKFLQWMRKLYRTGGFELGVCLIQRRHTISFEAFVRGKYNDRAELEIHKERLTVAERHSIRTKSWEGLYRQVMSDKDARYMHREKRRAKMLYDSINIDEFLNGETVFEEPSWEFPKGRRFVHETDRQCALREFEEESGVPTADVLLLDKWCEEEFCGTNKRMYRNKYYIAFVHPKTDGPFIDRNNTGQTSEVANTAWFLYKDANAILRPFHEEKRVALKTSYDEIVRILESET